MSSNVNKKVMTTFSCSGSVMNTNSINWSQNNSFCVIISEGLYIFESYLSPNESIQQQFPFHKSFIENPIETKVFDSGLNVTELMASSSLDEQHLLMMDNTLMTESANAPSFRSFRCVEWSPLCGQFGCLLGLLTLDHRLVIYCKLRSKWQMIIDLSLLLNEQIKQFWTPIDSPNYHIFKDRVYSLATVAFCWSKKWVQSSDGLTKSCVLYMGSKNGLITFWKILFDQQISAQFLYKWKTNFDQINCLKCFDDFLIISANNGLISVIHSGFCLDESPNPLSLWSEEDDIGVNHFAVKRIDKNTFDVMFTKSTFVIICRVNSEKRDDSITINLKSCKSVLGLHGMPSTGICSINDSKYLLTSMDGRLIEIEVSPDLTLKQCEVSLDGINSSAMCAFGIDCSPNACLCAIVQTITVYYDHLVIKDPLQIIVFSNVSFDHLVNILFDKYLSETPIATNSSILDAFDYLDCFRGFVSSNQNSTQYSLLFNLITNEDLIMNCNDLIKLRIIRFIAKVVLINCKPKESDETLLKIRLELCEEIILKLFIENLINSLTSNSELSDLNHNQICSLKNMNSWFSQRFETQIIKTNEFDFNAVTEFCPICDKEIEFLDRKVGFCSDSHQFMRCTNSLLLCDFVNYKYEKCIRCSNSIIIKPPIWRQFSICIYCD